MVTLGSKLFVDISYVFSYLLLILFVSSIPLAVIYGMVSRGELKTRKGKISLALILPLVSFPLLMVILSFIDGDTFHLPF